jgi:hypothetical protein
MLTHTKMDHLGQIKKFGRAQCTLGTVLNRFRNTIRTHSQRTQSGEAGKLAVKHQKNKMIKLVWRLLRQIHDIHIILFLREKKFPTKTPPEVYMKIPVC